MTESKYAPNQKRHAPRACEICAKPLPERRHGAMRLCSKACARRGERARAAERAAAAMPPRWTPPPYISLDDIVLDDE